MEKEEIKLRNECLDKKFYSFGTAKIFEKRAAKLKKNRNIITYFGFFSPILIGAFAASFSVESAILKAIIIPLAGLVTVAQALFSLWSLISRWDEKYDYSLKAIAENIKLTAEFEELEAEDIKTLKENIKSLREKYNRQDQSDSVQHITKEERRYGMREALFQYKWTCPTCKINPQTLKPGNCDTCGNF